LLIVKEMYDLTDTVDGCVELITSEQQQQQYSWLTQAAVTTLNTNLQKTFSYFNNFALPTFTSVLNTSNTTSTTLTNTDNTDYNASQASGENFNKLNKI
jgi:hypothetical protein